MIILRLTRRAGLRPLESGLLSDLLPGLMSELLSELLPGLRLISGREELGARSGTQVMRIRGTFW